MSDMLTIKEAAQVIGVEYDAVNKAVRRGTLAGERVEVERGPSAPWGYRILIPRAEAERYRDERKMGYVLTETQVAEIRERFEAEDISQAQLAREYGVSERTMSYVVRGMYVYDEGATHETP